MLKTLQIQCKMCQKHDSPNVLAGRRMGSPVGLSARTQPAEWARRAEPQVESPFSRRMGSKDRRMGSVVAEWVRLSPNGFVCRRMGSNCKLAEWALERQSAVWKHRIDPRRISPAAYCYSTRRSHLTPLFSARGKFNTGTGPCFA